MHVPVVAQSSVAGERLAGLVPGTCLAEKKGCTEDKKGSHRLQTPAAPFSIFIGHKPSGLPRRLSTALVAHIFSISPKFSRPPSFSSPNLQIQLHTCRVKPTSTNTHWQDEGTKRTRPPPIHRVDSTLCSAHDGSNAFPRPRRRPGLSPARGRRRDEERRKKKERKTTRG